MLSELWVLGTTVLHNSKTTQKAQGDIHRTYRNQTKNQMFKIHLPNHIFLTHIYTSFVFYLHCLYSLVVTFQAAAVFHFFGEFLWLTQLVWMLSYIIYIPILVDTFRYASACSRIASKLSSFLSSCYRTL